MGIKGKRIVVTGMGVVNSIAHGIEDFCRAMESGKCGIDFLEHVSYPGLSVAIGGEIKSFSLKEFLSSGTFPEALTGKIRPLLRRSPAVIETVIAAALQAFCDSRLPETGFHKEDFALVVAGSNLFQNLNFQIHEKHRASLGFTSPQYTLQFFDTNLVGILSEVFDIRGEGLTTGGASASGNLGIIKAWQLLAAGEGEICLVAGPMAEFSPLELQAFYNLGAMGGISFQDRPRAACRPFDRDHEGFIWGQGSGCLILETLDSAEKRNAPVLAEIGGGGIVLDGNHLSDARVEGEARAMTKALEKAGLAPGDVDYINAHGTSTPLGDEIELQAIEQVFSPRTREIWINSTKSLVGHCLYSAGIIEAIATVLQIRHGFIHPNLNLDHPVDPGFRFASGKGETGEIGVALSNSFGFGGINTSLVIKKY